MLSLDFWYFFFFFFEWNKTVFEKSTTSENVYIMFFFFFFENLVVHSGISLTRRKPLASATTNFVQQNGLIFAWVELWGDYG